MFILSFTGSMNIVNEGLRNPLVKIDGQHGSLAFPCSSDDTQGPDTLRQRDASLLAEVRRSTTTHRDHASHCRLEVDRQRLTAPWTPTRRNNQLI